MRHREGLESVLDQSEDFFSTRWLIIFKDIILCSRETSSGKTVVVIVFSKMVTKDPHFLSCHQWIISSCVIRQNCVSKCTEMESKSYHNQ